MKQINVFLLFFFSFSLSLNVTAQQVQTGEATYYADRFHGLLTAFGEKYDMAKFTAAHPTLDAGTMVKVTNLTNGKTVEVRVNDRGPNQKKHPNRIIDLSRAAAAQIDLINAGKAQVRVEVINNPNPNAPIERSAAVKVAPEPTPPPAEAIPESFSKPVQPKVVAPSKPQTAELLVAKGVAAPVKKSTKKILPAEPVVNKVKAKPVFEPVPSSELPKGEIMGAVKQGFAVQVGAYTHYDDAVAHVVGLKKKWFKNIFVVVKTGDDGISRYVVLMGPFENKNSASSYKVNLKKKYDVDGFVLKMW